MLPSNDAIDNKYDKVPAILPILQEHHYIASSPFATHFHGYGYIIHVGTLINE